MTIGKKNQKVADALLLWMINCDPDEKKYKKDVLTRWLAEVLNKSTGCVSLPAKLV
jgi:hypothetical protein